jgi:hypothetical protein
MATLLLFIPCFAQEPTIDSLEAESTLIFTRVTSADISAATVLTSVSNGQQIFDVSIPGSVNATGRYLLRVIYGDPATGIVTKKAIGVFGTDAKYGGAVPIIGTNARLEASDDAQNILTLQNMFTPAGLNLKVDSSLLSASDQILMVELVGTSELIIDAKVTSSTVWTQLPRKTLVWNYGTGGHFSPVIPGDIELTPDGAESVVTYKQPYKTLYQIGPPSNITPGTWGPAPGQRQPRRPGDGQIPVDFDGDGDQDYQLAGGDIVPGGGGLHYGVINLDDNLLTMVIWKDLDGDGIIDRNEVIAIIGQCIHKNANNELSLNKDSKFRRHIEQVCVNKGPQATTLNPPGISILPGGNITYDYNVDTGELIVTVVTRPGAQPQVIFKGPANGYTYWMGL